MTSTRAGLRRNLGAAFIATAVGGAAVAALVGPSATAATDPCAASEVSRTVGKVAANTGDYLDSHPQTNQALTTILQQQAGPQTLGSLKNYFDANPRVAKDLQALQQPLQTLGGRCKLPVTLPQLLGLMQAAQQQGPASLPGGSPSAQTVGVPGAAQPALTPPATSPVRSAGSPPGPSTATSR
ncbi:hemophore [Mycobacterium sp. NPDC003449]